MGQAELKFLQPFAPADTLLHMELRRSTVNKTPRAELRFQVPPVESVAPEGEHKRSSAMMYPKEPSMTGSFSSGTVPSDKCLLTVVQPVTSESIQEPRSTFA